MVTSASRLPGLFTKRLMGLREQKGPRPLESQAQIWYKVFSQPLKVSRPNSREGKQTPPLIGWSCKLTSQEVDMGRDEELGTLLHQSPTQTTRLLSPPSLRETGALGMNSLTH